MENQLSYLGLQWRSQCDQQHNHHHQESQHILGADGNQIIVRTSFGDRSRALL